jgi:hypothetical protein
MGGAHVVFVGIQSSFQGPSRAGGPRWTFPILGGAATSRRSLAGRALRIGAEISLGGGFLLPVDRPVKILFRDLRGRTPSAPASCLATLPGQRGRGAYVAVAVSSTVFRVPVVFLSGGRGSQAPMDDWPSGRVATVAHRRRFCAPFGAPRSASRGAESTQRRRLINHKIKNRPRPLQATQQATQQATRSAARALTPRARRRTSGRASRAPASSRRRSAGGRGSLSRAARAPRRRPSPRPAGSGPPP